MRLFDEVRAAGYPGGITQLRDYVACVRPRPEPEPVIRFETAPGLQAQLDFAEFRLPWGKRHALLVVLGYSRLLWLRFYLRQTMRTVIAGLEAAFALFRRRAARAAVRPDEGRDRRGPAARRRRLLENPEFLRFAAHWGFRIRACRPYRAQTKGKVERPVGYVRGNFVYGREFLGDADLEAQRRVAGRTANARVHGTTQGGPARALRARRARRAAPAGGAALPAARACSRRAAARSRPPPPPGR